MGNYHSIPYSFILILSLTAVTSCTDSHQGYQQTHDSHGDVLISEDVVILTSKHLASIKPEIYQPSLTLYGQLTPTNTDIISVPYDSHIQEIFVNEGQVVEKDDPLFSYINPALLTHTEIEIKESTEAKNPSSHSMSETSEVANTKNEDSNETINQSSKQSDNIESSEIAGAIADINTQTDIEIEKSQSKVNKKHADILLAPFTGVIRKIHYKNIRLAPEVNDISIINHQTPLVELEINDDFYFTSVLPMYTETQISVGQHVPFVAKYKTKDIKLTGQISDIQPINNESDISVKVHILPKMPKESFVDKKNKIVENSVDGYDDNTNNLNDKGNNDKISLSAGMAVQGKIDYGQMEVGTLVDKSGIVEKHPNSLAVFQETDAHVSAPVEAYVWIVGHNRKIRRLSIYVISYDVQTGQYLVSGVPSEVLIILANLPDSAEGKMLKVS